MADLRTTFIGVKSPNPFWLASAPPSDRKVNVERAFRAGWGGVVWKTLGEAGPPVVNVSGARYGAIHGPDRRLIAMNNIELITDRDLEINLQEIKEVKRAWPDRALITSLMVPCDEKSWEAILARVEETECDGVELNFGCPHGMSERGMGSAVGQVPEYVEMVARWCKAHTRMPVIVKLTPNISDIRQPARAAKTGGADAVSLINTINSIMNIDLDHMTPDVAIDGRGTHGGMCGPAVKPIALSMVSEIARDSVCAGIPISAIGGAGLHGCDDLRLQGRPGDGDRSRRLHGRQRLCDDRRLPRPRGSLDHRLAISQSQLRREGRDRSEALHPVWALPHRLRGHFTSGDLRPHQRQASVRGQRGRVRRLQSLHAGLPGRRLHHAGAQDAWRRSAHRPRLCPPARRLDDAPEQSGGPYKRGGVTVAVSAKRRCVIG
jgi:dihydroorotate dehydrogenase